jgi:hypothetical protein
VWSGEVRQANRDGTYPVQVSLDGGPVGSAVGTVRYWTLACAGRLRLESVAEDHLRLTEQITEGVENCVEVVPIRLDLDGDSLEYLASPGEVSQGDGTLERSTVVLPAEFTGTWAGDAYQASTDEEYPVRLLVRDGTVGTDAGSVFYPSLECSGGLRLELVAGAVAWFTETITTNERFPGCAPTGVVSLTLTGDSGAAFRYFEDPRDLTDPAVEGPVRLA